MLRIALIGYGKMGKMIHELASAKGHNVPLIIDLNQPGQLSDLDEEIDVAIEFSRPDAAVGNIQACLGAGVPVVSGTTGWLQHWDLIANEVNARSGALFYASNYSVGVNIFFALNTWLAEKLRSYDQFDVSVKEIHHTEKLDAPSGTAITLAEGIIQHQPKKTHWINEDANDSHALSIISERMAKVPGTHSVTYASTIDTIKIEHVAHSRIGFAQGALRAAEWLVGKQGIYGMSDLLDV